MHIFKAIKILFTCTILSSCGNYLDQKKSDSELNQTAQEKLSSDFSSVKEIIFVARCTACHQQYNNYQAVIRELSAIQNAIESNRMPKSGGPLNKSQKAILNAWIAKGAPNEIGNSSESSQQTPLEPNWKSISENLIFPKCLVCHNPQGQAKFLDLSSRQIIFNNRNRVFAGNLKLIDLDMLENSYLLQILNDNEEPMPPIWSNISRLTEDEIKTFNQWLRLGLP